MSEEVVRIGVVGTGHIARHFLLSLDDHPGYEASVVLTRRPLDTLADLAHHQLATNAVDALIERSDLIVECSGDPIHATEVVSAAVDAGIPVVTMDAEFQVSTASAFVAHGVVTEAEGDQPGSLAALAADARDQGFRPLVYGNMKGFLNFNPDPEEMAYWSERQGYSLAMVTAFTDGTKVNIEQALVANGLGAAIIQPGLAGVANDDLFAGGVELAQHAEALGRPVSDYVLSRNNSHGVFLIAQHDPRHQAALREYKMGDGPYYMLRKPDLTAYMEIMKTVKRVVRKQELFLDNSSSPTISVAAVTKRPVAAGTRVEQAIGSFDFRGICVRIAETPGHAPIGLMRDVVVTRNLEAGELVMLHDLDVPDSMAIRKWQEITAAVTPTSVSDPVPSQARNQVPSMAPSR